MITREEYWEGLGMDTPDDEPYVPESAYHFVQWFLRLSMGRKSGMSGAEAISDLDIWAWQMNSGERLEPREVDILMAMDGSFRAAIADEQEQQRQADKGRK